MQVQSFYAWMQFCWTKISCTFYGLCCLEYQDWISASIFPCEACKQATVGLNTKNAVSFYVFQFGFSKDEFNGNVRRVSTPFSHSPLISIPKEGVFRARCSLYTVSEYMERSSSSPLGWNPSWHIWQRLAGCVEIFCVVKYQRRGFKGLSASSTTIGNKLYWPPTRVWNLLTKLPCEARWHLHQLSFWRWMD